jgi:hypothetical protein
MLSFTVIICVANVPFRFFPAQERIYHCQASPEHVRVVLGCQNKPPKGRTRRMGGLYSGEHAPLFSASPKVQLNSYRIIRMPSPSGPKNSHSSTISESLSMRHMQPERRPTEEATPPNLPLQQAATAKTIILRFLHISNIALSKALSPCIPKEATSLAHGPHLSRKAAVRPSLSRASHQSSMQALLLMTLRLARSP